METVFKTMNLVMSLIAVYACWYAAFKGYIYMRWVYSMTAVLSMIYAAGYIWLLAEGEVATRLYILRGVSLISWPIVWIVPAFTSVRTHKIQMEVAEKIREFSG